MPLNPNIILQAGANRVQPRSALQSYGNVLAMQAAQQDMELKRNALEQSNAERNALAAAYNPETGELDPTKVRGALAGSGNLKGLMDYDKSQASLGKTKADREKAELATMKERIGLVGQILGTVTDQASLDAARPHLAQVIPDADQIPNIYDPSVIERARSMALTRSQQIDQMWKEKNFDLNERKFGETQRHNLTTEGLAERGKYGTTIYTGDVPETVPPDKTVVRDAQQGIQSGFEIAGRLRRIRDNYDPNFLTYQGRGKAAVAGVMDKAGISGKDDRAMLKQRRRFEQNVRREFNAYRKEITGAAAAVQEMEELKRSMMNVDQSPAEFEASFDEYVREIQRSMRIKARLLREGVRVGSEEFGKRFDDLFLSGGDDDISARALELEAQDISEEEGDAILKQEGYL